MIGTHKSSTLLISVAGSISSTEPDIQARCLIIISHQSQLQSQQETPQSPTRPPRWKSKADYFQEGGPIVFKAMGRPLETFSIILMFL
jgi:hypothetical protein